MKKLSTQAQDQRRPIMTPPRRPLNVRAICRRLHKHYGPVKPRAPRPVLDQLIVTILSQHTSDRNCHKAFEDLKQRFPTWEAVREASTEQVAEAIRSAGLSRQKAPRIKTILNQLYEEHGELSLEFLREKQPQAAFDYLCRMHGVGPKTAACVLLFSCHMPVLPVDTHVHRVSRRLGLIDQHVSAEKAHQVLGSQVPPELVLEFHVQLIRHGRRQCKARNPLCANCPLNDRCFFATQSSTRPA